jgi:transcriptional regulator with XRE-family HTH domain
MKTTQINNNTALIDVLKATREARGMTQYKLAKETGLQRSTILRIENGTSPPNIETILKIMEVLDCKLICASVG